MHAQNIRLVLSDVDGTLVTPDKKLTEATIAAARRLREAGVVLAITSSRPPRGLRMLVEPLALAAPIAGCNGGIIVNSDFSMIESHTLDLTTAEEAVDLLLGAGLDVWVYADDMWMLRDQAAAHVAREAGILQFSPTIVSAFTASRLGNAAKIVGVSDDFTAVAACETAAKAAFGERVSATRSQSYFLDVTHPQANKGEVVAALSRRLGISPDEIATIGDMPNDVLMFHKSGLSIAMGNASNDVKAQATASTDTNENDGFAKAIENLVMQAMSR